jgi:hypothetical protein
MQMFAVHMYLPFSYVHLELSDSNCYLGRKNTKRNLVVTCMKYNADYNNLVFPVYHSALHPVSPWLPCGPLEE